MSQDATMPSVSALHEEFASLAAELKRTVAVAQSPYRDREGAAAYLNCGLSAIDELMATGRVSKRYFGVKPLIPVKDLERVIQEDTESGKRRRAPQR